MGAGRQELRPRPSARSRLDGSLWPLSSLRVTQPQLSPEAAAGDPEPDPQLSRPPICEPGSLPRNQRSLFLVSRGAQELLALRRHLTGVPTFTSSEHMHFSSFCTVTELLVVSLSLFFNN